MRPKRLLGEAELLDFALKIVGGRAVSAGELREKLRQRAERKTDADTVLGKLRSLGAINDRQFAENFAARRRENEGFGKARVMRDLRGRRVAPAVAEQAVASAFEGTDEVALIEQFLARKYRRTPLAEVLAEPKGMAAVYRKLRLAGYSGGNSLRVLKRHASDAEALEALESMGGEDGPEAAGEE